MQQIPVEGRVCSLEVEKILLYVMHPAPCLRQVLSQADGRLDQDALASSSGTLVTQQPCHQPDPDRCFARELFDRPTAGMEKVMNSGLGKPGRLCEGGRGDLGLGDGWRVDGRLRKHCGQRLAGRSR